MDGNNPDLAVFSDFMYNGNGTKCSLYSLKCVTLSVVNFTPTFVCLKFFVLSLDDGPIGHSVIYEHVI